MSGHAPSASLTPSSPARALDERPQRQAALGAELDGRDGKGGGQQRGQAGDGLLDGLDALPGDGVLGGRAAQHLQMHRGRVQRPAQVVDEPVELRRQTLAAAGVHQGRRADFTAWMPYFASLL